MELIADLPRHIYCQVDRRFLSAGERDGFERVSWFGLTSMPGRAWGLSLLLECGAVYSHVPPHAIAFSPDPAAWTLPEAQRWDCFGVHFAVHEYEQLQGRDVDAYIKPRGEWLRGQYLFTAQHYGDGYSRAPDQAKQYHFIELELGRLAVLPGNCVLFHDQAFTRIDGKPAWLRVQTEVYSCESRDVAPWDNTITEETA